MKADHTFFPDLIEQIEFYLLFFHVFFVELVVITVLLVVLGLFLTHPLADELVHCWL